MNLMQIFKLKILVKKKKKQNTFHFHSSVKINFPILRSHPTKHAITRHSDSYDGDRSLFLSTSRLMRKKKSGACDVIVDQAKLRDNKGNMQEWIAI